MSTTTDVRPGEAEFEPLPPLTAPEAGATPVLGVTPEPWVPTVRATRARRRRFRLSRRARLARTVLVLLALEVTLSSIGVVPGHGWPLSLFGGHGADASARSGAVIGPTDQQASRPSPGAAKRPAQPALWAFASYKQVTLYVPTHRMLGIGYHEAATPDALPLTPIGHCVSNDNRGRIHAPATSVGPDYVILQSRHRAQGPTTAADVAMPKGATVVAPVSGWVVQVQAYRLYKYWLDYRVVIRPAPHTRLRVIMIHLTDLVIRKGQAVVAGVTPIGHPRVFSFRSDINRYVGAGVPHVHLEVKEIGPPGRKA